MWIFYHNNRNVRKRGGKINAISRYHERRHEKRRWSESGSMACRMRTSLSGLSESDYMDPDDGLEFDDTAKKEIFDQLDKDYISGITFSGGDPLHPANINGVLELIEEIKQKYPDKTIWLYTGYTWEQLFDSNNKPYSKRGEVVQNVDVIVDGMFVQNLLDVNYPWAGSRNQRVILVQETIKNPGKIVLY